MQGIGEAVLLLVVIIRPLWFVFVQENGISKNEMSISVLNKQPPWNSIALVSSFQLLAGEVHHAPALLSQCLPLLHPLWQVPSRELVRLGVGGAADWLKDSAQGGFSKHCTYQQCRFVVLFEGRSLDTWLDDTPQARKLAHPVPWSSTWGSHLVMVPSFWAVQQLLVGGRYYLLIFMPIALSTIFFANTLYSP